MSPPPSSTFDFAYITNCSYKILFFRTITETHGLLTKEVDLRQKASMKMLIEELMRGVSPLFRVYCSSTAKHNLNVDSIGNLDPHELPEGTLVGVQIDEPLVNAHLPAIPSLASLSVR